MWSIKHICPKSFNIIVIYMVISSTTIRFSLVNESTTLSFMLKKSISFLWHLCLSFVFCILCFVSTLDIELKGNGIFLMQNDKSYFTYDNSKSNPPPTVNTAKFDCLDLSGPPCIPKIVYAPNHDIFFLSFWHTVIA